MEHVLRRPVSAPRRARKPSHETSDEGIDCLVRAVWGTIQIAVENVVSEVGHGAGDARRTGVIKGDKAEMLARVTVPGRVACAKTSMPNGVMSGDVYSLENIALRQYVMRRVFSSERLLGEQQWSNTLFEVKFVPDPDEVHIHLSRVEKHGLGELNQRLLERCSALAPRTPGSFVTWSLPCVMREDPSITRPVTFNNLDCIFGARLMDIPEVRGAPSISAIMNALRVEIRRKHGRAVNIDI